MSTDDHVDEDRTSRKRRLSTKALIAIITATALVVAVGVGVLLIGPARTTAAYAPFFEALVQSRNEVFGHSEPDKSGVYPEVFHNGSVLGYGGAISGGMESRNVTIQPPLSRKGEPEVDITQPDMIVSAESHLFINQGTRIVVVEAAGEQTSQLGAIDIADIINDRDLRANIDELMVTSMMLIAFVSIYHHTVGMDATVEAYGWMSYDADDVAVMFFDITNPSHPELVTQMKQSGVYWGSCLTDGVLHVFTRYPIVDQMDPRNPTTFIPQVDTGHSRRVLTGQELDILPTIYIPAYTIVTSITTSTQQLLGAHGFLGDLDMMHLTAHNLYVVAPEFLNPDEVPNPEPQDYHLFTHLFRLGATDLHVEAQGNLRGRLALGPFIDEYDDHLRMAIWNQSLEDQSTMSLSVFDSSLTRIGHLESFVDLETINTMQWMGTVAYVITGENVDTLITMDLSDPPQPTVAGETGVSGLSGFLYPLTDHQLLGVGPSTDGEEARLHITVFDVTDPHQVTEFAHLRFDAWRSEADRNRRAAFVDTAQGLTGFGAERNVALPSPEFDDVLYMVLPDITGMSLTAALKTLHSSGVPINSINLNFVSSDGAVGRVLSVNYSPGFDVPRSAILDVTLGKHSGAGPSFPGPPCQQNGESCHLDITGLSVEDIVLGLHSSGFTVFLEGQYSDSPVGSPLPTECVWTTEDKACIVRVSQGPMLPIPQVVGLSYREATDALIAAGREVYVEYFYGDSDKESEVTEVECSDSTRYCNLTVMLGRAGVSDSPGVRNYYFFSWDGSNFTAEAVLNIDRVTSEDNGFLGRGFQVGDYFYVVTLQGVLVCDESYTRIKTLGIA